MGRRPHRGSSPRQGGFTLIELLVAILILALLSAIAIPVFLRQREKAWVAQLRAGLRNGATAEETVMAETGAYTADEAALRSDGGWRTAPAVSLTAGTKVGGDSYCLEGTHGRLRVDHPSKIAHFSSEVGTFGVGPCPGSGGSGGDDDDDDDGEDEDEDDSDDDD